MGRGGPRSQAPPTARPRPEGCPFPTPRLFPARLPPGLRLSQPRPLGERQGARSPGGETRSPARAPGPLRPSPLPRTSPRALQYTVPEQALVSGSRRPGRATCARLSRAPPPGRSRPAPGHSARSPAPAAFPAPPRPAPPRARPPPRWPFPPPHPARPSVFPVRPGGRTLGGSGRATVVTPFSEILGWKWAPYRSNQHLPSALKGSGVAHLRDSLGAEPFAGSMPQPVPP
ncbi:hypothetical protein AB1E18_014032 [Capra hircus]